SEAIHRAGGSSNAYTTFDRTVYYVDAPEEGFETAMEAVSEMVFAPIIAEEDARLEREVILREIAMRDDEHDSVLAEAVLAEAVRRNPFRHPIIGHKDLFVSLTAEDLRAYHRGRYVTSNVVLALGGSMEAERAFDAAERWFGRHARRPLQDSSPAEEPPQAGPRRADVVREVSTLRGVSCWRAPALFDQGRQAFDVFVGLLGGGQSSPLWSELRDGRRLVHSIDVSVFGTRQLGLAWAGWNADASADASVIEAAVSEVAARTARTGIDQASLDRVRRQSVVALVNGQKSIHGITARSASAAASGHDVGWTLRTVRQLAALTTDDIAAEAARWISGDNLTSGTLRGANPARIKPRRTGCAAQEGEFQVRRLHNGVRVVLQRDDSLPKAGFGAFMSAGGPYESPEKRGATALLSTMLTKDAGGRTRAEISAEVDRLGLTFGEHSSQLSCGLWAEGLVSDSIPAFRLAADGLLSPAFESEAFEQERAAQIAACREAEDDIVEKARLALLRQFFGNHPLSVDPSGDAVTLAANTREDVVALHRSLVNPANLVLGFSGDFDVEEAVSRAAERFESLPAAPFVRRSFVRHVPSARASARMEAAGEQAVVALAFPHCGFGTEEVVSAGIVDELLSGMASGLFRRVREERGLAYFVGSSRVEAVDQGMFYLFAGTAPGAEQEVLREMREELARIRRGDFLPDEIDAVKRRIRVARRQGRQSPGARIQGAMLRELVGLGANFDAEWERRMGAAGPVQVSAYASQWLRQAHEQELVALPRRP
ncbi:MAG: M16 family metallopeptidase, partial [Opitutales bacterium]